MGTQSIMFQGTASDSGKSWVAAGLCRILKNRGLKVAPFKSQNMALNSYITADGKEMGRAQVFQAEAAGVAPDVRMNPLLLKPSTDQESQVVFMGKVLTDMTAVEYQDHKMALKDRVLETYQSLAAENDVMVLEGAGSPAEINLDTKGLVNMGMAEMANAPGRDTVVRLRKWAALEPNGGMRRRHLAPHLAALIACLAHGLDHRWCPAKHPQWHHLSG